jgi:hypothetical protein
MAAEGVEATAQEVDGEFTVRGGSTTRRNWVGTAHGYQQLREKLEGDGTLTASADDKTMLFTRDLVFASPSAAAAVVFGRVSNGREAWKADGVGISFGEWQNRLLEGMQT